MRKKFRKIASKTRSTVPMPNSGWYKRIDIGIFVEFRVSVDGEHEFKERWREMGKVFWANVEPVCKLRKLEMTRQMFDIRSKDVSVPHCQ